MLYTKQIRILFDNINVTKINNMKVFKVTKEATWMKHGVPTNYVNFMKANNIEEVIKYFGLDAIQQVEEV